MTRHFIGRLLGWVAISLALWCDNQMHPHETLSWYMFPIWFLVGVGGAHLGELLGGDEK